MNLLPICSFLPKEKSAQSGLIKLDEHPSYWQLNNLHIIKTQKLEEYGEEKERLERVEFSRQISYQLYTNKQNSGKLYEYYVNSCKYQ